MFEMFLNVVGTYGKTKNVVLHLILSFRSTDLYWPSWLDTSNHGGKFPNNIDAGAEFIVLLLQAINKCSHGKMPAYFEVMNEPDAFWQNVDWDTVIDFHKLVAQKVKAKFPHMYVGGPTKTSIISVANKNNFQFWQLDERFLNMSVDHLDFYSFHPYNDFYVEGNNYRWEGINEARLVGYIDMVENHANLRKGHGIELIISEFGVGSIHGIDQNKPSPLIDWAHAYQHNAHMFTYQGFRDVINRAVGFLLANEQYLGQESLHYSLFNHDGSERHAAKAYRFWHHLKYNYKYLRIDSPFDNKERHISPVALVNPDDGTVAILLHNYDTNWITVNLKFPNNWMRVGSGKETCMYLNSQKIPVLDEEKNMNSQNNNLYMRPESSCIFKFHANQNWGGLKQLQEKIYYGQNTKMGIKRDCQICIFSCQGCEYSVQTRVNVGSTSNLQYAKLRVAVTRDGRTGGNLTPKAVTLNGHQLSNHYQLFLPGRGHEDSRWEVFVYNVPTSFVHQGGNTVKLAFYQDGGHVSTAAIITGG